MATDISTPAIQAVSAVVGEPFVPGEDSIPLPELQVQNAAEHHSTARFQTFVTTFEVLGDVVAVVVGLLLAYTVYYEFHLGRHISYSAPELVTGAFVVAVFYILMLKGNGAYGTESSLLRVRETERVLRVSARMYLLTYALSLLAQFPVSRYVVTLGFTFIPILVLSEKHLIYYFVQVLHKRGFGVRRVVIYGAGISGQRVFSALTRSPKLGLDPVKVVDEEPARAGKTIYEAGYTGRRSTRIAEGPITAAALRRLSAEMVVVTQPSISPAKFRAIAREAANAGAALAFIPHHSAAPEYSVTYSDVDGILLAWVGNRETRRGYELAKRVFDLVVASAMLIMLGPLLLVVAAAIKLTSRGPVLFVQERVGKGGKLFQMYKFRTMHEDAPQYACSPKTSADPRITPLGVRLRRTSLDEVPQLINVVKGDMSLVGPRPEMPFIVAQYRPIHRQRLQVPQGITGLWQLSADRAYAIHENIGYDLYYVRNRNFFMDVAIMLHTIAVAMRGI